MKIMQKTILVIVAMERELSQLLQLLQDAHEEKIADFTYHVGRMGEARMVMLQCGYGKVNAAIGATLMIQNYKPDLVVSTGVAGGIDASLNVMDVVMSTEVVYHDVWCGEDYEIGQVQGLPTRFKCAEIAFDAPVVRGLICSGDQFVSSKEEQQKIKANFPDGLAVDMESGALAQTCYRFGLPFVSLRVISDTPGAVEEHWAQWTDFWAAIADKSFGTVHRFLEEITNNK